MQFSKPVVCVTCVLALALASCTKSNQSSGLSDTTKDGRLAPRLMNLGALHLPVTTKSADAQKFFDQGLTLVYGFNHAEALRSFREAARLDDSCAMCFWGQALALSPNINDSAIGDDREQQGGFAIAQALQRKSDARDYEQALIDAMAARFRKQETPPEQLEKTGEAKAAAVCAQTPASTNSQRAALNEAYAAAMKRVYDKFPKYPDIATLYTDAVMNTMPWDYWKQNKPKPGIMEAKTALEAALRAHPDHPGANHIYIHLLEASDYVDQAVPSAERLGNLVPAAGHLVHMPSHIFIRVGRYDEASEANIRAIAADEDYITQCRAQGIYPAAYYPHNIHFLTFTLAMGGRAKQTLDAANKVASKHDDAALREPGFGFSHLLRTMPLMTMVRFGLWEDILAVPAPTAPSAYVKGIWHFARGFAYSATNKHNEAMGELKALRTSAADPGLAELKIFDLNNLQNLAAVAVNMLEGETAARAGNWNKAIAAYEKATTIEEGLLYNEPPDWLLPPRQYLGAALLSAGKAKQAESAFRADLKRHRDNGWSLRGLQAALEAQNRTAEAKEVAAQLMRAWAKSDITPSSSRL